MPDYVCYNMCDMEVGTFPKKKVLYTVRFNHFNSQIKCFLDASVPLHYYSQGLLY